nr:MAG TPA: hypothetical protein [Caudoviricetes sp.]
MHDLNSRLLFLSKHLEHLPFILNLSNPLILLDF